MRTTTLVRIVLAALLACTGCAVRVASTPADTIPAAAPTSPPQKPPSPPAAPDVPSPGTGSAPAGEAPAAAAANPPAPAGKPAESQPPPATESAYVFSPAQAVSAPPSAAPTPAPPPAAGSPKQDDATADSPGALQLVVATAPEVATGQITTVDVMASSSSPVVDAPLHLSFDPNVLEYVDGAPGDFLTQGGSSVVFLADGLSRPGDVAVAAGRVERERGASGSGLLCRVRLRGLRPGTTPLLVGRAKAWGPRGEALTVVTAGTTVVVR